MEFGVVPVRAAEGAILAHGVRAGETRFKKGRALSTDDIEALAGAGIDWVMVARLEAGDVREDEAASRVGALCGSAAVRTGAAFTGRVNLYAESAGVVTVDGETIAALNGIDEALTIATLPSFSRVAKGQMLATIKIIAFAAPKTAVETAERVLGEHGPPLRVHAFAPRRTALISTSLPGMKASLLEKNRAAIEDRLAALGSELVFERRVPHETEAVRAAIEDAAAAGADPIMLLGASAITDRRDVIPAAIAGAGGEILRFGMPVDPGNLLLLGRLDDRDVIGVPTCARSPKLNGFDFVLWRLLAGLPVDSGGIAAMGVGGLLTEIASRPQPRDERPAAVPRLPKIAAIVLAAGTSSRMGENKLLKAVGGKPLVRRAVEAAMDSASSHVIVVVGDKPDAVRSAVAAPGAFFVENPDFAGGLSTSLKCGLKAVPADCDGAVVLLSDMPEVSSALVDKLIAAFDPSESRAICIATHHGKRGNPVLWAKRFFPEMMALDGDVGARQLIRLHSEMVCEVEAPDDAPLIDLDTPEALEAYRARKAEAAV